MTRDKSKQTKQGLIIPLLNDIDNLSIQMQKLVEYALNSEEPDNILITIFTRIRQKLKETKGTTPTIPSIVELLYFTYIEKYLIKNTEIKKFNRKSIGKEPNEQYYFEADYNQAKIILSSNLLLTHFNLMIKWKKKPDIFIGMKKKEKIVPLAIFEIKLKIDKSKFEDDIINRFMEAKEIFQGKPYLICLFLEYPPSYMNNNTWLEMMKKFTKISEKKALMMRKVQSDWNRRTKTWDGSIEGININQVLDLIIKEIKLQNFERLT